MRAKHLFEENIYVLSNFVVAKNGLFREKKDCARFQEKIDFYLTPICEIYQYYIGVDQFHLIIRLKNRQAIEEYYRSIKCEGNISEAEIPLSTYIFSQAMANLQSSTAIHFNRKNGRKGAVFARRFYKHLIESEVELKMWLQQLKNLKTKTVQSLKWRFRIKSRVLKVSLSDRLNYLRSGYIFYKNNSEKHPFIKSFRRYLLEEFQGQFEKPVLRRINGLIMTNSPP